jgi:hypothetical protein
MSDDTQYDWASAIAALASTESNDFVELARAAKLSPMDGDFSDADFSGLDLSGQNLAGWDLKNAKFLNSRLTRTELRNAQINPEELIDAIDWESANLDDGVRAAAEKAQRRRTSTLSRRVVELELSVRTMQCFKLAEIEYIGDLVQRSEAELLRIQNFGRKSLTEVRERLVPFGLHLGMEVENWERPGLVATKP